MKVQIENQITAHNLLWVKDLNTIIHYAKDAKDLNDLANKLGSKKYQTLTYGFGTNHCWVKQMDMNCNLNEHRTLFITEK
jgi:hypothetical protein